MRDLSQKLGMEHHHDKQMKTILIVDDEVVIRELCSRALKGYRLLEAGSGEAALALFDKGGIDVILTDVMMPGMDGIELLKRIKEKDPTIVVIVMTGFAEKDVILNALKADADDFISKPLNLLQLKTAVQKALIKKALKDEIASLRSLDRLKSNFLSIISHKFRTPITAISLFLQNIGSNTFKSNDPELRANVRLVSDESAYLERLVAELLVFSRMMVHGESLTCEPVSLARTINDIVAGSREIAAKPAIETILDIQQTPDIHADRDKITFALQQVIDNAYKFSGETGKVTVVLREKGETAVVSVTDTGCGIAAEEIPKIFEKFYQVDPYNTGQVRGFGLGLYYAREFVRMHGGGITVESVVGKGTQVVISIPLQTASSVC